MTFPLPPREAVIYAEFVRLLDAREVDSVTEGAAEGGPTGRGGPTREEMQVRSLLLDAAPSVTEPLFELRKKEAA